MSSVLLRVDSVLASLSKDECALMHKCTGEDMARDQLQVESSPAASPHIMTSHRPLNLGGIFSRKQMFRERFCVQTHWLLCLGFWE